jgi:hypothetical protein
METAMAEQSTLHPYLSWTKQRLDEMDATLASLEAKAGKLQADSKVKADAAIGEMKKQRDAFSAAAKAQAKATGAAVEANRKQMEAQWHGFEGQVKAYFDSVGKQGEQQWAAFQDIAKAQTKAWREAIDTFHGEVGKIAAARRADVDSAVKQMKADAMEAEARLKKVHEAGTQSWAALSAALAESRKAFDRANQKAADAVKNAGPEKAA